MEAALFVPDMFWPPPGWLTPDNAGERLHLRFERQTLVRLPKSGAVLFLIKSCTHPLRRLPDALRPTLLAYLRALPPAHASFRMLHHDNGALECYLSGGRPTQPALWTAFGAATLGAILGYALAAAVFA